MTKRFLTLVDRFLVLACSALSRLGLFGLFAYLATRVFAGVESSNYVTLHVLYSIAGTFLLLAGFFRVVFHRTPHVAGFLPAALAFFAAPVVLSWWAFDKYIPNVVVSVLIATVMLAQHFTRPAHARQMQRVGAGTMYDAADHQQFLFPAQPVTEKLSTLIGMAEVKARLLEAGQEIIPSKNGRAKALSARNGILLFGEPGNGKTLFARALAGELGLPMVYVTFGDVASKWINNTTEQVVRSFSDARAQAPCVLFLDEIDSLGKNREDATTGGTDESAKTTNALLTELVKIRDYPVVVVAATNFIDRLDQALIREKRFDFKVEITPPDQPAREVLIASAVQGHAQLRVEDAAISLAARRWQGFSAARICSITEDAVRSAIKEKRQLIRYPDLQRALRAVQGRKGAIPEDTPDLAELVMPSVQKQRVMGLAARMCDIERVEALGGTVPTGVLFWGPPGTGKTLTARALAKTTGWAFIAVTGNELASQPDRIEEIERQARDLRPCMIFIDEADDILADRRCSPNMASVTNRLLSAIDGARGKVSDVVWIAATNHPDNMDSAALRGGRFTEKLEFGLPDESTVAEFVRKWTEKSRARFADDMVPERIAAELSGLSVANIAAALQQAVDLTIERIGSGAEGDATCLADVIQARSLVAGIG